MAVNRVGEKGPGLTSAASELRGRALGNESSVSREDKRKRLLYGLTTSYDRQSDAQADSHQHGLANIPNKEGSEFSSCLNALLTFCSQTTGPSFQKKPRHKAFTYIILPPLTF